VEDAAQVISRMCDIAMIRTFEQEIVARFAAHSRVPVINGLTKNTIPARSLRTSTPSSSGAGRSAAKTVAWIGDSNNVCNTWLQAAEVLGFNVHVSTRRLRSRAGARRASTATDHYEEFDDPMEAARGADLVTTDVWTSMGFEAENEERKRDFEEWQVDAENDAACQPRCLFMHCLPAHRGEEVAAEVIDGPQSVVWEEAENRLHTQKALMEYLLLGRMEENRKSK